MIAAVIALGVICLVLCGLFALLLRWADRRVAIEIEARKEERVLYDRGLVAVRTAHTVEIERLRETYEKMIEAQGLTQRTAIEHLMNLIQFGQPSRAVAVVEEREPDAATRAARQVTEETVARAVTALREGYEQIGVPVTNEELEAEARSMMVGGRYVPPASLAGMLRD